MGNTWSVLLILGYAGCRTERQAMALNACSKSAMMSAIFSIPTETYVESQHLPSKPAERTYTDEVRGDARCELLFCTQLLMCRRRRMDDQCLRIAFTR